MPWASTRARGQTLTAFLPSVPPNNDLNDMTRGLHALSIDNTTSLGTADSTEALSTDGQGETLLSVIDEDLSARYSRLRAEARILMQAHIDSVQLTQYIARILTFTR